MAARWPSERDVGCHARYRLGFRTLLCRYHRRELDVPFYPPCCFFNRHYSVLDCRGMAFSEANLKSRSRLLIQQQCSSCSRAATLRTKNRPSALGRNPQALGHTQNTCQAASGIRPAAVTPQPCYLYDLRQGYQRDIAMDARSRVGTGLPLGSSCVR